MGSWSFLLDKIQIWQVLMYIIELWRNEAQVILSQRHEGQCNDIKECAELISRAKQKDMVFWNIFDFFLDYEWLSWTNPLDH